MDGLACPQERWRVIDVIGDYQEDWASLIEGVFVYHEA